MGTRRKFARSTITEGFCGQSNAEQVMSVFTSGGLGSSFDTPTRKSRTKVFFSTLR